MKAKKALSWGLLIIVLSLAAGIASCSNADERPTDTFFPMFPNPLPKSPVGLIITDPVFRQVEPDPLTTESYKAANLDIMTSADMWAYFAGATQRIDIVGTRVTNPEMVARLVGIANKGVQINMVIEQGYFNDPSAAPFIAQLAQTGNITIKTDDDGVTRQVHSHYAIIDDHIVFASSGDFLDNSFNTSINNTLMFNTPRTYTNGTGAAGVSTITDAFLFDFDQMFNMGRFGGDKERLINHTFNIGVQVEIYFGPNDNLLAEIIDEVNNLQDSLYYAINQISDPTMLSVCANLGVAGFYDFPTNGDLSEILELATPFAWAGFNGLGHKVLMIDLPGDVTTTINPVILNILDPVTITGSCNWTHNGLELNDEQLIIVHDLTLGFEFAIEIGVLQREAQGTGVVFGVVRTNKDVPIEGATLTCDSEAIPGGIFPGDGGTPPEGETDGRGYYAMLVPTGFLRNIQVTGLGDASGLYILPDPLWGETMPNEGWNLMPGSSYRANFYVSPAPSQTGTGGGGSGGGGGFGG